jgi:histidinol-phosphate aminotransferase
MSLKLALNPMLKDLPVYQPGRPIEEVARELGLPVDSIIKMASNENPLGPSPLAMAAIEKALTQLHLYPDGNAFYLKHKLAQKLGVTPAHLVLGTGSNEIIEFVSHALMRPGAEVIVSQYCFAIYPIMAKMFGAKVVTVPAHDYGHDLEAMAKAVNSSTTVMFVANPNNPTGTLASTESLMKLVSAVPQNVLLVFDEAYIEFLDKPADLVSLIRKGTNPNLLVMRTFSKIYGLAGLRLGYGIGDPEFVTALEKVRQPFNVNAVAQIGALAALDDGEHIHRARQTNAQGLKFWEQACKAMGLLYVPSAANFILIQTGNGEQVFKELQKQGVIVRPMGGYQLPEFVRISVGTPSENERCLAALKKVLGK